MSLIQNDLQMSEQKQAFRPMTDRKIILSTNIAETSITIEDVVYVIDGGKVKEKSMDPASGTCQLKSQWISKVLLFSTKYVGHKIDYFLDSLS
jgi:ATP-dependent RNA helicase DHX57